MRWKTKVVGLFLGLIVAGAVGAVVIYTHILPPVSVFGITSPCNGQLRWNKPAVPVGTSGVILFSCAFGWPGSQPAFHALEGTQAWPTFVLRGSWSFLYIYPHLDQPDQPPNVDTCDGIPGAKKLITSDTPTTDTVITFSTVLDWNYCAQFGPTTFEGSLPEISVGWNLHNA